MFSGIDEVYHGSILDIDLFLNSVVSFSVCIADSIRVMIVRPQRPLRLIRDGEVGGVENFLHLTPTRYIVSPPEWLY